MLPCVMRLQNVVVQGDNHAQLLILLLNSLVQKVHVPQALLNLLCVSHRLGE